MAIMELLEPGPVLRIAQIESDAPQARSSGTQ
jgi:hypothetical protein